MKSNVGNHQQRWQKICLLLPLMLIVQALSLGLNPIGTARAEGFSDPTFQSQWSETDQAVATGQANRTYFWGPQPFAHTSEVYDDSPNNGQREVQYFDKARMELSKKNGQDPTLVTNGLLTVELVTGQLQVGDNHFLQRSPATNPVAGDQVGNPLTPTYASFNQGKLAFGVTGATASSDRTGQNIAEAVNVAGQVTTLSNPPVSLKYARYFSDTGHNLADVFNTFFQQAPLGEDKWLSMMGYPIAEPFWAKNKVVVGGKAKDVLMQLFQRRVLTYTPSNPAGFQVEMGNIGQHYYVWRYGFDPRDQLPGNYRQISSLNNTLYSINLRNSSDKVMLGSTTTNISGIWTLNEGRAVVTTRDKVYLADLTKARPFKELVRPTINGVDSSQLGVIKVVGSPDGTKIAVAYGSYSNYKIVIQIYNVSPLPGDNIAVSDTYQALTLQTDYYSYFYYPIAISADSRYLSSSARDGLHIFDLNNRQDKVIDLVGKASWLGSSHKLLVFYKGTQSTSPGKVSLVDADSGATQTIVDKPALIEAAPSPDGNYFGLIEENTSQNFYYTKNYLLNFQSIEHPGTNLTSPYAFSTNSDGPTEKPQINSWSPDGTYVLITTLNPTDGGGGYYINNLVSAVNGQALEVSKITINSAQTSYRMDLVAGYYTVEYLYNYNGPRNPADYSVTLQNLDGSERSVINLNKVIPGQDGVANGRVVQVPVVNK